MVELQKEGKVKYLGLMRNTYIRRVSKVAKIDALQIEANAGFWHSYSCTNGLLQFSPFTLIPLISNQRDSDSLPGTRDFNRLLFLPWSRQAQRNYTNGVRTADDLSQVYQRAR
jgi:hypothetical protein